jgi:hypothetical protein
MTTHQRALLDLGHNQMLTLRRLHFAADVTGRIDPTIYQRERRSFPDHLHMLRKERWIVEHPDGPIYLGSGPIHEPSLAPLTRSIVTTATGGDA